MKSHKPACDLRHPKLTGCALAGVDMATDDNLRTGKGSSVSVGRRGRDREEERGGRGEKLFEKTSKHRLRGHSQKDGSFPRPF